jgi:hypothetical protein
MASEAPGAGPPRLTRRLLAPWDGAGYRKSSLELGADGSITLVRHDLGPGLEAAWGADDAEVSVRLAPDAVARLAFALLAETLADREDAAEVLAELCDTHGVSPIVARWT